MALLLGIPMLSVATLVAKSTSSLVTARRNTPCRIEFENTFARSVSYRGPFDQPEEDP
jgi:hypothetical protein